MSSEPRRDVPSACQGSDAGWKMATSSCRAALTVRRTREKDEMRDVSRHDDGDDARIATSVVFSG
eukprot:scaffold168477_cov25-Tisochrysis_lutea.AAC.1